MPGRRTQRYFSPLDRENLLEVIKTCRVGVIRAGSQMPPTCPEYKAVSGVIEAIDDLAGALTGDREYFWTKIAPSVVK